MDQPTDTAQRADTARRIGSAVICRLLAWLFGPPDYRAPWTTTPHGGGPLLDDELARRAERIRAHVRQEDTGAGAPPKRISDAHAPRSVP
jgi:hypothetical protein